MRSPYIAEEVPSKGPFSFLHFQAMDGQLHSTTHRLPLCVLPRHRLAQRQQGQLIMDCNLLNCEPNGTFLFKLLVSEMCTAVESGQTQQGPGHGWPHQAQERVICFILRKMKVIVESYTGE